MRTRPTYPVLATLLLTSLSLSGLGAVVGRACSLALLSAAQVQAEPEAALLWLLGFTLLGAIQGALLLPAALLGQRRLPDALRAGASGALLLGSLCTCAVAVLLWRQLGAGPQLSLLIARGLLLLCAGPLLAFAMTRRRTGARPSGLQPALGGV